MISMNVSRQRRYQRRRRAEGKCETCGRPEFQAGQCRSHYILRVMRRLAPDRAHALTRQVLSEIHALELQAIPVTREHAIHSYKTSRWVAKWARRFGRGNNENVG